MRIAVVGSRDYPHREAVEAYVDGLGPDDVVISGGARGVDSWAVARAEQRGLGTIVIPADWETYGKSAGYRRNTEIVEAAEHLVAFWHNGSRGTRDTIRKARERHVTCTIFSTGATSPNMIV